MPELHVAAVHRSPCKAALKIPAILSSGLITNIYCIHSTKLPAVKRTSILPLSASNHLFAAILCGMSDGADDVRLVRPFFQPGFCAREMLRHQMFR